MCPQTKEIKQAALTEMIEFIKAMPSAVTPRVYPGVVRMFSANLFRSLPPPFVPP
jgi:serine/threonine-protein phosphatase 2A regulatory subunit B'